MRNERSLKKQLIELQNVLYGYGVEWQAQQD
jgi:hypothetical protein